MNYRKSFLGCALVCVLSIGAVSQAQQPVDQTTYFTFSAPVELPGGKTLPAGKYTFRVADSPSNRHIVQIMKDERGPILATILAIPAQRQDPPSDAEVRFMEAAANMPPAIRTWWYPGRTVGHEFIYPRGQARRLAANQREGVLTVADDATSVESMQKADLARIEPSGQEMPVRGETGQDQQARAEVRQPAVPPSPTPQQGTPSTAQPRSTPQAPRTAEPAANDQPRTELPQTASSLPLVGLLGIASLVGAALVRFRR